MANKITIDLEVDDNGNLKKVGKGAREAADGLELSLIHI